MSSFLERSFAERPLRVWDLCCGGGRHTLAVARRGHKVYASDGSSNGVALLEAGLAAAHLVAETAVADMTACPWPDVAFHAVVSWDSLHHNVVSGIREAVGRAYGCLVPGGWFLVTLKSTRADSFGVGTEIEPGTFVQDSGRESGVAHHYFTEAEVREMFADWELQVLVERISSYKERCAGFLGVNPFGYTSWGVLARKSRSGESTEA